jgi:IS5 family transposase
MPDESTILRFRHRLEKHKMAEQVLATVIDPALVDLNYSIMSPA